eukprot:CAMPEP_0174238842 /NCGR_PEP_ID=MMETSP0417-20130205/12755_1 /TAXON_ID=242541 /ORGANISM="Mayorella sp, Strain BSH-02190019" /LENGTH=378 /DNA_ID=CAMNT_0015317729 /DNA_START=242 /DNA_END=1374 /DNA_ORIENTATION=+
MRRPRLRSDYPTTLGGTLSPRGVPQSSQSCTRLDTFLAALGLIGVLLGLYHILSSYPGVVLLSQQQPQMPMRSAIVERPILHGWAEDAQPHEQTGTADDPNLLTVLVKTLDRPQHLFRLLDSIRAFYPRLPIYVADDGSDPIRTEAVCKQFDYVRYYRLPWDSGMSAGLNLLLSQVKSTYFLLIEDDFELTANTNLDGMLELMKRHEADVIGGKVLAADGKGEPYQPPFQYNGLLTTQTQHGIYSLILSKGHAQTKLISVPNGPNCPYVHFVPPFFMARTSSIRDKDIGGWDLNLKASGYMDFWLRLKDYGRRVAVCEQFEVVERFDTDDEPLHYATIRGRSLRQSPYVREWMNKHEFERYVDCVTDGALEESPEILA